MFSQSIFRANDIRGVYPKEFALSFTKSLAKALCLLAKEKKVQEPKFLIGHDARLTSPEISESLKKHLKAEGAGVSFIGLAPSPLCYFLLSYYNLTACIVVTASHNPSEYNGFKILFHKKHKMKKVIQKIKKILLLKNLPKKVLLSKGWEFFVEKEKPYIESLKKEFSLQDISFAIDTGNGALGPLAKKVFSSLGLQPHYLFSKPDGRFPNHHPDPTIEKNLFPLKEHVQKKNLELGFGFDGDGDRLAVVAKNGKTIFPDEFGLLFIKNLIKSCQKAPTVLADVKCSDWLFKQAKKEGAKILMSASGHGLIREKMEKEQALLVIEFSGHIFFNNKSNRGSDDALYASLKLLEFLNQIKKPFLSILPKNPWLQTEEIRLDLTPSQIQKKLRQIRAYLKKRRENFIAIDGIRLSRKTSWCLFRSSKTQSVLSMRFSANSKKNLQKLKKEFSEVIDLKIP